MGEYHDLYLKTDVLLLTDILENFREVCMQDYGLDPVYCYTLPNFAFDAMLKLTGVEIDLVYDQDMYEMIETGLRGGMTQTACKKVEANTIHIGDDFDESKESSYINYFDAHNLYGLAMIQKLPYKNLKWDTKITEDDILNYANGNTGYILEVDVEYPKELHDLQKDYPMAPEIMNVKADMLSDKQVAIYEILNKKKPKDEKTNRLILNFKDKEKYVVHIRTLQFYLERGLKLKKIHRAIKFSQKEILKPYIEFNTDKRKNANNDFEKDVYKLMNNAVFGKTMEDKRKHLEFEIASDETRFMKCVNNPSFTHSHIISDNLVGVEKQKAQLKLDKPIFIGMSILDLSKQHMYKFYYDVMKPTEIILEWLTLIVLYFILKLMASIKIFMILKRKWIFQIILFIINAMILLIKKFLVNLRMNVVAKLLQGLLDFVLSVTLFKSMEKKKNIRNARAQQST